MSEIKKNIETCRGEDVLAEVSAAPQDPHFGSLVNEALDPLKQQAAAQEGWDGYSEVIAQHKPYTFASAIIQMKSNLLLLLRALWQFPFGSGTLRSLSDDASLRSLSDDASLRSLADMWQHYITRLQGNETYGIPSRLSSLTDLPSAPLLLADRKISGVPEAEDGMSLVRLLTDSDYANMITDLDDNSTLPYEYTKWLGNIFPNLERLRLSISSVTVGYSTSAFTQSNLKVLRLPYFETFNGIGSTGGEQGCLVNGTSLEELYLDSLTTINRVAANTSNPAKIVARCSTLKKVYMPSMGNFWTNVSSGNSFASHFYQCPNVEEIEVGKLTAFNSINFMQYAENSPMPNLIKFVIGQDTAINLDLSYWNPTNALDASLDTLVTDEDCHNNLEQFLKNFRTYIALRLATFASNVPTLTLSQAVFSSIWDANGNPQVLQDGLDQLRADIHNIVKTTKHWDVNKAN